jgi:hypothetical protein
MCVAPRMRPVFLLFEVTHISPLTELKIRGLQGVFPYYTHIAPTELNPGWTLFPGARHITLLTELKPQYAIHSKTYLSS